MVAEAVAVMAAVVAAAKAKVVAVVAKHGA